MSAPVLQVATCAVLLTVSGVWGAPFASEEEANQFLRLKRQAPYSQSYWDPSSSQNAWGFTVAEQAVESWTALRTTAQYYMDLGSFSFYPDTTRDQIQSYMDMLQQSGTHFQRQTSRHN
ncbi:uncharacterized protein C3orf85 homolog [Eublepharis macularius]|uniref:Uncharacterized protein C3orf85 homolog n=1 Tax=Eublepharis macularius TaxID=481883 RepID=A0AA97J3Z5_EUBMA|nr:uncharacterized protein C3orf85 homolog [Eublepharis macularius]